MQELMTEDPALLAQRPIMTTAALTSNAIEYLLSYCVLDEQLLADTRQLVASHHFLPVEAAHRLAWDAICRSTDLHGGVSFESLVTTAQELLDNDPNAVFSDDQREMIFRVDHYGLLYSLVNSGIPHNPVNTQLARNTLKKFVYQRTIVDPLRKIMSPSMNPGVPEGLDTFLEQLTRQQARISTTQAVPVLDIAPEIGTELVQANQFVSTGVPFFDNTIGGQRIGDVNGILGPTGGGKTTMGIHMAVAMAKNAWTDAQAAGIPSQQVIFVTAEQSAKKLRPMIWSAFCEIARKKLEQLRDWSELSTPGNWEDYERRKYAGTEPDLWLSEIERYQAYRPQMEEAMRIIDMSGSDDFPHAGQGYIPELASYVEHFARNSPSGIRAVIIDWAGILCERYMQAQNMDPSQYRYLLKTFGDRCRVEISERFNTTTWVIHQLRGDKGNANPTIPMHHTDASESKDFAVHMSVCACLGTEDMATGCRILNFSKVRYHEREGLIPVPLKIDKTFAKFIDVSSHYTIDTAQRRILTADEAQQISGMEHADNHEPALAGGNRGAGNAEELM